jgi:mannose-6-phosphate isomerase-like protein (cupin superfamily)
MPIIKAKDLKEVREKNCGSIAVWYPVGPENDLLDWMIVKRTKDQDEKWRFQAHKHRDFEEYWFILEGKGTIYIGDEAHPVEKGDLAILPRDVPHWISGDIEFICTTAKHNVYGQSVGNRMQFEATDKPYRDNPEEIPKVGEYFEVDLSVKNYQCLRSKK